MNRRRLRRSFPWLLLGAGLAVVLALALFSASAPVASTHSSTSDAADGTAALYRTAAETGHQAVRLRDPSPGAATSLLFVFSPNAAYTAEEALRYRRFVEAGGTLVYASEQPDPFLDRAFGLARLGQPTQYLVAYTPGPFFAGVHEVSGGAQTLPFLSLFANQVPVLRGPLGEILGLEVHIGRGLLLAFADPLPLCNGYLLRSDNARLIADLLGTAGPGGVVAFDESHHVVAAPPAAAPAPPPTVLPWLLAIVWAALVGYIGLALRGRGFGPRIPLAPRQARSTAEYVDAVATLLRRSGGRRQAADLLLGATRVALARRIGGRALGTGDLPEALAQRSPELSERLREAEAAVGRAGASEAALLEAARRLHDLDAAAPETRR